jgi:glutamate formiminotransferase/formiminotetrahydrofolate cyclodeaminase
VAFDTVCDRAQARGLRVSGSELVGVLPLDAMLEAGRYFLRKQKRSVGVSDKELIKIAVKSLGLDELYPFEPDKKIIEYILDNDAKKGKKQLVDMTLIEFADETASESPAPGGGSIAAYMGALGSSLGGMVANLSSHKRGWDDRWEEFSNHAEKAKYYQTRLLKMVDEDTNAFNKIMDAFGLPKKSDEEKAIRSKAIQDATKYATEVPFETMKLCFESMQVMKAMAENGNPNSVTDAGVGAIAARAGVLGAFLNVKINAAELADKSFAADIINKGDDIMNKTNQLENDILKIVEGKI